VVNSVYSGARGGCRFGSRSFAAAAAVSDADDSLETPLVTASPSYRWLQSALPGPANNTKRYFKLTAEGMKLLALLPLPTGMILLN
jgi:hypothetical protein